MSDKKKKKQAASVQIYSRVRKLMPWEPTKISVKILNQTTVQNKTDKKTAQYTFSHIFNMTKTNEDIYRVMGKPLVRKVLEGFNAVLIAYGQTGSGKTHTLVGKPEQNVMGVLPLMLQELFHSEAVHQLSVSGVEAYGTHVSRIELYDLFNPTNLEQDWTKKKGQGGLEPKKATEKKVNQLKDCWDRINEAHDASHFAPTGKNPESSRGHVGFVTKIQQENASNGSITTSYLIVVDLAGSEGESAFTPEFVKKVDPPTLMARRLEAGCINTGLSQLQVVFNELKVKGKLSKSRGTGLRRILHAYINSNCMISVMFTLSPAFTNRVTTGSTLKFAVQAGMVKVTPVKAKAQVNYKTLVAELQKHVAQQLRLIEKLNDDIEKLTDKNGDFELKIKQLTAKLGGKNDAIHANDIVIADAEKKRRRLQKSAFKRQKSRMSDKLQSDLNVFNAVQDSDEDDDGYIQLSIDDQKSMVNNHLSATKVDSDIKRIHTLRKSAGIDTNMLNQTIRELDISVTKVKVETPKPHTFQVDLSGGDDKWEDEDDDPDNIPSFSDIKERQNTIKASLAGQSNMFDDNQYENKDEDDDEYNGDFQIFTVMDTEAMSQKELIDYCDQLESKLIEEKTLRYGLQKSQQVIIDHLMETNEALLQWFKIKKIL